ncbi:MAG: short-chain dehydrogenase [Betaproteobacteria bacterium]|nr:MAG: short-chain dehydrogenase [Betaproteobacteria bacterium]
MADGFAGKVVVVSGGSRGIGRGIAAAFAAAGARVVLAASSAERLAAAAEAIAAQGGERPLACAADLRTPEGCAAVAAFVDERLGRCDVLVNSAGATRAGAFLALDEATWQDGFALKFFGCVRLCRLFWPMLKDAGGHVVNVIGGAARTPDPEFLIGGSVNAAMHNFTKGLAGLGRRDGVNVNAILPGLTQTERVEQLFRQRAEAAGTSVEEVRRAQIAKEGIARLGTPEDIAALALFLCSASARHIQGAAIAVDGGATPGLY